MANDRVHDCYRRGWHKLAGYVIGLDGVITTGNTVDQVIENMREAIPFHLEGMGLHGDQRPRALPIVKTIQIAS